MRSFKRFSGFRPVASFGVFALCLGTLVGFSAPPVWAQNAAGGVISGQVTDQQGAAVPGASIRLTETSTNSTTNTTTNDAGRYTFPTVSPGVYDLVVTKEGFALTRMPAQKVDVGLALTINVALQLGQPSTIVEVSAAAAQICRR